MSDIVMRAKMYVIGVSDIGDQEGSKTGEELHLQAVTSADPDSENYVWSKWTPSAQIRLSVTNPNMFGKFVVGDEYYIDFTPAEK